MTSTMIADSLAAVGRVETFRQKGSRIVRGGMEAVVLAMVCLSPWAFGAVEPAFELFLYIGLAILLVLWGVRMLFEGCITWIKDPAALCLAVLFLTGILQLTPLPRSLLGLLSPNAVHFYDSLLPAEPEVLPLGEEKAEAALPARATVSLYPGATRRQLLRLLGVFLLYAIIRNNIASSAALRRLSGAALVNGALLSLLGLAQLFSSAPNKIYWLYPSPGNSFGPFINRNHFPFYVNMCIGLGIGLLCASPGLLRSARSRHVHRSERNTLLGLLQEPRVLWISIALALMIGSIALCRSRGGFLALFGATIVFLVLKLTRSPRFSRIDTGLLIVAGAAVLVCWFGFDLVMNRLNSLFNIETMQDPRVALWSNALPLVKEFPLLGTGYGTYATVEPLYRQTGDALGSIYEHAHNDYLEALIEGGLIQLVLSILTIGIIFRFGYRAYVQNEGHAAGGLALGALWAFTTIVIHSFFDFGLHIPAVAVLATVLSAYLCALGMAEREDEHGSVYAVLGQNEENVIFFRLGGLAPLLGAATTCLLALIFFGEGRKNEIFHRYRIAARMLGKEGNLDRIKRKINYLQAAVQLVPENAQLQLELGQAYVNLFDRIVEKEQKCAPIARAADTILAWNVGGYSSGSVHPALVAAPSWLLAEQAAGAREQEEKKELSGSYLAPGLRHILLARDLCPLLPMPHLLLAANVGQLDRSDGRNDYLERGKKLIPADPDFWFLCGVQERDDGDNNAALKSWRKSLELSDLYLGAILDRSVPLLGREQHGKFLDQLLPKKPDVLVAAALYLHPRKDFVEKRRPFLEKAQELLQSQAGPARAADLRLEAVIAHNLDQPEEAVAFYRRALAFEPLKVGWRLELAKLYQEQGNLREARGQLFIVLNQERDNKQAQDLLNVMQHEPLEPR